MLLDSDVLIDVALERDPHLGPSSELLILIARRRAPAFVAWHSLSNIHYIVARARGQQEARRFIADLLRFTEVAETGTEDLRHALDLPMADFEDALQAAAARACGARHIVTRNVADFARSPIPAITPAEALARLAR